MHTEASATRAPGRWVASPSRPLLRRLQLLGLVAAAVLGALATSRPEAWILSDPDLTRLLRGMALIKTGLVAGAVVAVLWRLGWPVPLGPGALYGAGAALMAGASVWIWQPTFIAPAAVVFHAGIVALLVAALFDGRESERRLR